jgi:ribosomal protein S18 acetylase RimI-like enzyme
VRPLETAGGIEFGLMERAELGAMADVLAEAFSRHDPPAVAVGLPAPQIRQIVLAFGSRAAADQLTVIARESSTGELLGAVLVEDFTAPPPAGLDRSAPDFAPVGALLESLDNRFRAMREISPGTHLHVFMVGVADGAAGRGVASRLVSLCLANAGLRGYRHAVAEATGLASQHIFRRHGFRDLLSAPYRDFLFEGKPVFSSIVGPEATILMEREI